MRSNSSPTKREPDSTCGEALGGAGGVAQHPQEPVRLAEVVAEPAEGEQPVVGVGALGEPLQHDRQQVALDRRAPRDAAGERGDVPQRARRVAEADRREPRLGLLAREREPLVGQRRDRRQQRPVEQPLVQARARVLACAASAR